MGKEYNNSRRNSTSAPNRQRVRGERGAAEKSSVEVKEDNRGYGKKRKKSGRREVLIWFLAISLSNIIVEIFLEIKNIECPFVYQFMAGGGGAAGLVKLGARIKVTREKNMSFTTALRKACRRLSEVALEFPLITLWIIISSSFVMDSLAAEYHTTGKLLKVLTGIETSLIRNTENLDGEGDTESETESEVGSDPGQDTQGNRNTDLASNEDSTQKAVKTDKIVVTIREDQIEEVYFKSAKNQIENWEDIGEINAEVKHFYHERFGEEKADEPINLAYEEATKEANKLESEYGDNMNAQQRQAVIVEREKAFVSAKTEEICGLIAKDYHELALLVKTDSALFESCIVLSIWWRFRQLEYAGADKTFILHDIHSRYRELADNQYKQPISGILEMAFRFECINEGGACSGETGDNNQSK